MAYSVHVYRPFSSRRSIASVCRIFVTFMGEIKSEVIPPPPSTSEHMALTNCQTAACTIGWVGRGGFFVKKIKTGGTFLTCVVFYIHPPLLGAINDSRYGESLQLIL